jgi:hypothetical protein
MRPTPDADLSSQRHLVDAFLAAARGGSFDALLEVLDPDVVLVSTAARCARPLAVAGFTIARGRIVQIDLLADPARLRDLDLTVLDD